MDEEIDDKDDIEWEEWEPFTFFDREACTCEHENVSHSWDGCQEEGCHCKASWTE